MAQACAHLCCRYNKKSAAGFGRCGRAHGYAVVTQGTRGRFASEGESLPFHLDVGDGKDTAVRLCDVYPDGRNAGYAALLSKVSRF